MDIDDIKRGLRSEIKKRENEQYATFQCNVRQMCKDVLAKLEEQEQEIAGLNVMLQEACLERDENPVVDELTEQIRHQKYKRCLAKKDECKVRSERYQDLWEKWRETELDTSGSYYKNYIKWWHRAMKWRSIAEKFKERKNAED